jgi:hypothetical protein
MVLSENTDTRVISMFPAFNILFPIILLSEDVPPKEMLFVMFPLHKPLLAREKLITASQVLFDTCGLIDKAKSRGGVVELGA